MPDPISNTNSSFYDPSAQFTPADSATPSADVTAESGPAITIPPVIITGDAGE